MRLTISRPLQELGIAGFVLGVALIPALWSGEMAADATVLRVVLLVIFLASGWLLIGRLRRRELSRHSGAILVYGGFALWYAYPGLLFALGGVPEWYDYPVGWNVPASIAVLLVGLSLGLTVRVGRDRYGSSVRRPRRSASSEGRMVGVGALLLVLIGLWPYLVRIGDPAGLINLLLASRAVAKPWVPVANLGTRETLLPAVSIMLLVAGATLLTSRMLFGSGSKLWRALGLIALATIVGSVVLDHGTRTFLVIVFGPAVVIALSRVGRHSRKGALVLTVSLAAVLFLSAQIVGSVRALGSQYRSEAEYLADWYSLGGSVDFFSETAFALSLVPARHDFFYESTAVQFLTYPIPRAFWPDKPVSKVIRFYVYERWNRDLLRDGGNVFPGVVGQQYMSTGVIGVLITGLLLGAAGSLIGRQVSGRLESNDIYGPTVWLMLAIWLFLSFRVLSPVFLTPVLVAWLLVNSGRLPFLRTGRRRRLYRTAEISA